MFRNAGLKDFLKGLIENKGFFENIIQTFKDVSNIDDNSFEESLFVEFFT